MPDTHHAPALPLVSERLRVAMRLQEIEGNPLDADDFAVFEMFEREGWTSNSAGIHRCGG